MSESLEDKEARIEFTMLKDLARWEAIFFVLLEETRDAKGKHYFKAASMADQVERFLKKCDSQREAQLWPTEVHRVAS